MSISFKDRPFLYDTNGGSLKISLSYGCFLMKYHLFMIICFKLATNCRYCLTKGEIRLFSLRFCWRANFLSSKLTSESVFCKKAFWVPLLWSCFLKFLIISSNNVLEEFVLNSLKASPLVKPLLTPGGWHEEIV